MPTETGDRFAVDGRWLLRLRWFAAAGQLITVAVAKWGLHVDLWLTPLLAVIAFTAASNLALEAWVRSGQRRRGSKMIRPRLLAGVMTLDLLLLTALLCFAGGPANPFLVFFFINLALAAVVLPASWAWLLSGAATVCIALLFMWHYRVERLESLEPGAVAIRHQGLFVALVACTFVVTYFITRVTRELRQRVAQLRVAEEQRARSERLEALATLAAGAGHELASPLSTIAVVTKELTKHLEGADVPDTVLEDMSLIRSELDHCRSILDRMSGAAGQAVGEGVVPVTVERLLEEVLGGMRHPQRVQLELDSPCRQRELVAPLQGLAQALRGVVQNALDASPDGQPVTIRGQLRDERILLQVIDRGNGMSPEVLRRAGDPFFTTKEPGQGMGLGLFLTRSVLQRLGGSLELKSEPGRGATATIELPGAEPE